MSSPGCDLQAAAQKVQRRLLNKPRHPAQLAADIVERVVATGGEPYLDTKAQTLPWWQLSLLDVKLFLAVVVTALLCFWGGLLWVTARVLIRVGKRMLGSTRRRHAVQRKKVRSIRLTKEKLATCFVVFCAVYVVVYVGQIIDLGTVNATSRSVLDMLSNEYDLRVLQSDQSVECVASQYTKEDICNDA